VEISFKTSQSDAFLDGSFFEPGKIWDLYQSYLMVQMNLVLPGQYDRGKQSSTHLRAHKPSIHISDDQQYRWNGYDL